jgi:hypothetical protein
MTLKKKVNRRKRNLGDGENKVPVSSLSFKKERLAAMACTDNLVFTNPIQIHQREIREFNYLNFPRSTVGDIDDGKAGILRDKSKLISRRGPTNSLNPATSIILAKRILAKGQALAVRSILRSLIDTLDKSGKHSDFRVARSCGNQNISRMPVD